MTPLMKKTVISLVLETTNWLSFVILVYENYNHNYWRLKKCSDYLPYLFLVVVLKIEKWVNITNSTN